MCLLATCISSLDKVLFQFFAHIKIGFSKLLNFKRMGEEMQYPEKTAKVGENLGNQQVFGNLGKRESF